MIIVIILVVFLLKKENDLPVLSNISDELIQESLDLSTINIDAIFLPDKNQLLVSQSIQYINKTNSVLDNIVLRTYANAFNSMDTSPAATNEFFDVCYPNGFSSGNLIISSLKYNNDDCFYGFSDEARTVLQIKPEQSLNINESALIELEYIINIPECAFRFGENNLIYSFGNCIITPAIWEDEAFRKDDYTSIGDPFINECFNYNVNLSIPKAYTCVASVCAQSGTQTTENNILSFKALALRDFAFVISSRYETSIKKIGDVVLTASATTKNNANILLENISSTFTFMNDYCGGYPYQSLSICTIDFPFKTVEYAGLILVSEETLLKNNEDIELSIMHATAQQWWSCLIGSDQIYQPWQDESLSEYMCLPYIQSKYGINAKNDLYFNTYEPSMRITIAQGITPGSPISYFSTLYDYSILVHDRGVCAIEALNISVGDNVFQEFLKKYLQKYKYKIAQRDDFFDTLEQVSGNDWSAIAEDYLDTAITLY